MIKTAILDKISLIVPVYNVEKFLSQCLESIINQTYTNLEIIVINDGSTDSSPQICDIFAANDSRIKVFYRENGGLSVARNYGVEKSTGDFIAFIDSDDIIAPDFCEKMLQSLLKHDADLAECDFKKFEEKEIPIFEILSPPISEDIYNAENALALLMTEDLKQMACNKMFTSKVIQGINFEINKKHEDEFWTYKIIGASKRIVQRKEVLYFYRQHPKSIMGTSYNVGRLDGLVALQERVSYMKENFPKLENLAIKVFSLGSLWHYQKIEKHAEIDMQKILRNKIWNDVKTYNKISNFKNWKLKEILWIQFFILAPTIFVKFRNVINVGI